MNKVDLIRRGQIYEIDFGTPMGSEQGGVRPAVVIQNDIGNKYSPTIIVCPITSRFSKKELPTHIAIKEFENAGLDRLSQVLAEQISTKDKRKVLRYIGSIDSMTMGMIDRAIEISVQVGQNKLNSESREVSVVKRMVKEIEELDSFVRMWLSYNNDIEPIKEQMKERELKIKSLEKYANDKKINYRNYYNPIIKEKENNRMVG